MTSPFLPRDGKHRCKTERERENNRIKKQNHETFVIISHTVNIVIIKQKLYMVCWKSDMQGTVFFAKFPPLALKGDRIDRLLHICKNMYSIFLQLKFMLQINLPLSRGLLCNSFCNIPSLVLLQWRLPESKCDQDIFLHTPTVHTERKHFRI